MDLRDELASSTRNFAGGWRGFFLDDALVIYDEQEDTLAEVTPDFGSFLVRAVTPTGQSVSAILGLRPRS